ncbi:MAG TPA: hypothetical protein VFR80_07540 [Pyrinomonadaceae bacterium]|nr:hypothetical protein [Pyrinomonadaceae bacterium]
MIRTSSSSGKESFSIFIRAIALLLGIFFPQVAGAVTCLAQVPVEEFQKTLSTRAGLTADDWSALERGGVVVRLLPAADKREVRVYGLTRVQGSPDVVVKAFQGSMVQQKNESLLSKGKFSDPPTLGDVETLFLEHSDIEDLKTCVVGKCELKMSAAMMGRFHREVNWDALDYRSQANRLYREVLIDYVRDYQTRGDAALIEYHDQRRAVLVRDEQQALFDRLLYVHDFTPEFANYLKRFPSSELSNVESHISWTKVKFGFKPVIIVTHVVTYQPPHSRQVLTVSKQLYSNHYLDSSLAMTAVIGTPTSTGDDSYLLYSNYSRSDSLTGSFARLRRGVVETESLDNLNALLQQTRANLHVESANQSGSDPGVRQNRVSEWLFQGARLYAWLFALFVFILIVLSRLNARDIRGRSGSRSRRSS